MSIFRRYIALFVALMVLSCVSVQARGFSDVPSTHAAGKAITWCQGQGIISGYSDDKFRPDDLITGHDFEIMFERMFDNVDIEIVLGDTVTRYDAAVLVTYVSDACNKSADSYDCIAAGMEILDYNLISMEYKPAVANVYALNIMRGLSDGKFHGENKITRAQAAVIAYRTYQALIPRSGRSVLSNNLEITEANVLDMITQLKFAYPSGTAFPGYSRMDIAFIPENNSIRDIVESYIVTGTEDDICSTDTGCGGWAAFMLDYIFGQDAVFRKSDLNHIRPGDLMLKLDSAGRIAHVQVYIGPVKGELSRRCVRIANANNGLGVPTAAGSTAYDILWTDAVVVGNRYDIYTAYSE